MITTYNKPIAINIYEAMPRCGIVAAFFFSYISEDAEIVNNKQERQISGK